MVSIYGALAQHNLTAKKLQGTLNNVCNLWEYYKLGYSGGFQL